MTVPVAYGKRTLDIRLPEGADSTVIRPAFVPGAVDEIAAVRDALRNPIASAPLSDSVRAEDSVGIVFSDITRPTPYHLIIPPILEELAHVPDENIVFFNATGTHRPNSREELVTILGEEVVRRFRIVQNECSAESAHEYVGTTAGGNRIEILREFLKCDFTIPTGFIEPHFFAGMSGGGKAIMPGLASLATVQHNHSVARMDHPNVRWGVTEGNPLWEEVREAALFSDPSFIVNVALNRNKEITRVFAGDFLEAHRVGCEVVREEAMAAVDRPFDLVVTSNSGYPLDLNMYQAVKGMSAASQVLRDGGHIIMAAECWDGIPEHGRYGALLAGAHSPQELLAKLRSPGFVEHDMWQAQIHALVCEQATVHFHSENLSDEQVRTRFMEPVHDIANRIDRLVSDGDVRRICVLPEGPATIPYIAGREAGAGL